MANQEWCRQEMDADVFAEFLANQEARREMETD